MPHNSHSARKRKPWFMFVSVAGLSVCVLFIALAFVLRVESTPVEIEYQEWVASYDPREGPYSIDQLSSDFLAFQSCSRDIDCRLLWKSPIYPDCGIAANADLVDFNRDDFEELRRAHFASHEARPALMNKVREDRGFYCAVGILEPRCELELCKVVRAGELKTRFVDPDATEPDR